MQAEISYNTETYPPRGRAWPQFGDDVLQQTMSISDGVRQSLNLKKQAMSDFHKDNLQYHNLAPREERPPPLQDPSPAEALEMRTNDRGDDPPSFPRLQRGVPSAARPPGAVRYGDDDLPFTTPDYDMTPQRASVQEGLQLPSFGAGQGRAREAMRTQAPAEIGLRTPATPQIVSDMSVDQVSDADVVNRVDKRLRDVKLESDKQPRQMKVKSEPKAVKQEASHRGPGSTPSSSRPPPVPDDEVEVSGVTFNNNEDMSFWEQASANEMKAQLNLRYPQLLGDFKYKSRPELISTIRGLIRQNQWSQEAQPSRGRAGRSRSPPPRAALAPTEDDDDVEVSGVSWDQSTDLAYWNQQAASYIRQQLSAKFPNERQKFAFFTERKEYIDYITDLIKKKKYP